MYESTNDCPTLIKFRMYYYFLIIIFEIFEDAVLSRGVLNGRFSERKSQRSSSTLVAGYKSNMFFFNFLN